MTRASRPVGTLLLLSACILLSSCGGSRPNARPLDSNSGVVADSIPNGLALSDEDPANSIATFTHDADGAFRRGVQAVRADSLDRARDHWALALRRDPSHGAALTHLSRLLYQRGQSEEAIGWIRAAERDARQHGTTLEPAVLAGCALHLDALGRNVEALVLLDSLLAHEPHLKDWGGLETYLGLRSNDPARGVRAAESTASNDRSPPARNNLGIARLHQGDAKSARTLFVEAAREDPSLPGPHYNLAIVEHFYFFDDEAAVRHFARYRELRTDDPDGLEAVLERKEN